MFRDKTWFYGHFILILAINKPLTTTFASINFQFAAY